VAVRVACVEGYVLLVVVFEDGDGPRIHATLPVQSLLKTGRQLIVLRLISRPSRRRLIHHIRERLLNCRVKKPTRVIVVKVGINFCLHLIPIALSFLKRDLWDVFVGYFLQQESEGLYVVDDYLESLPKTPRPRQHLIPLLIYPLLRQMHISNLIQYHRRYEKARIRKTNSKQRKK
jgi:hypothetical protein